MKSDFGAIRRRFQIRIVLQLAAIAVVIGALFSSVSRSGLPTLSLVLVIAIVGQVAALLNFIALEHRKLERFLDALAFDDLSLRLAEDDWDQQLAQAANHIIGSVRDARVETEEKATYLDALVKHLPVAILALDSDGRVVLQNNAARHLFRVPQLGHIDGLSIYGKHLPRRLRALVPGQRRLIRAAGNGQHLELSASATEIRLGGGSVQSLIAIENIGSELDQREVLAWRDLIRVLTHEIMNSVTPIASLARTVDALVEDLRASGADTETLEDMHDALRTITRRSEGLVRFVDGYRQVTDIPQPRLSERRVGELLNDVVRLCREDFGETVDFDVAVEPARLEASMDPDMIQQAIINLTRNACFAVAEVNQPRVSLRGARHHGRIRIVIEDNGVGISDEDLPQIFIPFFTTRRGGSGVGMTLARQILAAHRGSIAVTSEPGKGTCVTLTL